jgi:hypothetical protein
MRIGLVVCLLALALLVAAILYGVEHGPVLAGLVTVAREPWGLATLVDLAVGLGFVAAWMSLVEARRWRLGLWLPLLVCLGNVATLLFLLARWPGCGSIRAWLTERR